MNNDETKRCEPTIVVDALFPGPLGYVLLRSEDRVALYDVQQRKSFSELQITGVKAVYWALDFSVVALITKDCKNKNKCTHTKKEKEIEMKCEFNVNFFILMFLFSNCRCKPQVRTIVFSS